MNAVHWRSLCLPNSLWKRDGLWDLLYEMTDTMPSYRLHVKPRCVSRREPSIHRHTSDKRTENPKSPSLILWVPASALTPKLLDF